jgi:hypothetical protein
VGKRGREVEGKWKPRGAVCGLGSGRKIQQGGRRRLLLKKKKIKFFRVRIFLLFFVVKNASPA